MTHVSVFLTLISGMDLSFTVSLSWSIKLMSHGKVVIKKGKVLNKIILKSKYETHFV